MKKRKYVYGSAVIFLAGVTSAVYFLWPEKKFVTEHRQVLLQNQQVEKNIDGIYNYMLGDFEVHAETGVEEYEFDGEVRRWLVVRVNDASAWEKLSSDEKYEMLTGLINTSRLQIDRDFGGVQIFVNDQLSTWGRWRHDQGYVIVDL